MICLEMRKDWCGCRLPCEGQGALEAGRDLGDTRWGSELVNGDKCTDATEEGDFARIWDPLVRGLVNTVFRMWFLFLTLTNYYYS